MNCFEIFLESSLLSTVSKKTKMIGHHSRLRDMMGQSYPIFACTCAYLSVHVTFCGSSKHTLQSRSQSFVPLDQRSVNESCGSIHFRHAPWIPYMQTAHACAVKPDMQNSVISIVIWKGMLPELSFSDRWSRGTKLWERDCILHFK